MGVHIGVTGQTEKDEKKKKRETKYSLWVGGPIGQLPKRLVEREERGQRRGGGKEGKNKG